MVLVMSIYCSELLQHLPSCQPVVANVQCFEPGFPLYESATDRLDAFVAQLIAFHRQLSESFILF